MRITLSLLLSSLALGSPIAQSEPATTSTDYAKEALNAVINLRNNVEFMNNDTGRLKSGGGNSATRGADIWWPTGSYLETIARFGQQQGEAKQFAVEFAERLYSKGQNMDGQATNWIAKFYDDNGWFAMGWIAAYDLTGNGAYLDLAKDIYKTFGEQAAKPPAACQKDGYGILWAKDSKDVAVIANELYFSVAAHLANREQNPEEKQKYINDAVGQMEWLTNIVGDKLQQNGLFYDKLDGNQDCSADSVTKHIFTYNQGVVLAGLSELSKVEPNGNYLETAKILARSSITSNTAINVNGILKEGNSVHGDTTAVFKGAYIRGLGVLQSNINDGGIAAFIKTNADALIQNAKVSDGSFTDTWHTRDVSDGTIRATSLASAIDLLAVAAAAQ